MALPGKLTVGFLQEDNPQKSFFRFRPLLVEEAEGLAPFMEGAEAFPEEGYVRIVPDKNEIGHFKVRMRQLGGYCALDLRKFVSDNNKIRPNKNYAANGAEHNAFIVYSDVIGPLPKALLAEVLDATGLFDAEELTLRAPKPCTHYVAVFKDGRVTGPWVWRGTEDVPGCITLSKRPQAGAFVLEGEALDVHLLALPGEEGEERKFIGGLAELGLIEEPEVVEPVAEPVPEAPAEAESAPEADAPPAETPEAPVGSAETPAEPLAEAPAEPDAPADLEAPLKPAALDAPAKPAALEAPAKPVALEAPAKPAVSETPAKPAVSEAPAKPAVKRAAEPTPRPKPIAKPAEPERPARVGAKPQAEAIRPAPAEEIPEPKEKLWLHRDESILPRAVNSRLSLREQSMQAQTGINPRRGRSLHEVVDEQWRKSRLDQLGAPVPPDAPGTPVLSPIEKAAAAVQAAWAIDSARPGLLLALTKDEELRRALNEALLPRAADGSLMQEPLNELEAARLKLLGDIDQLKQKRLELRKTLMEELREANRAEFAEYERKNQALLREIASNEHAADNARKAAESAGTLFEKVYDEQFEQRLVERLAQSRAKELLLHMVGEKQHETLGHLPVYEPSAGALISDVRVSFEKSGVPLTNDEAVNLLLCLTISGACVVSGASGTGKSTLIRTLARALGLTRPEARRFAQIDSAKDEAVKRFAELDDGMTLALLMMDDINVLGDDERLEDVIQIREQASQHPTLRLLATVQDAPDGTPLSARMLDHVFMLRLLPEAADAAWQPLEREAPLPEFAVSWNALKRAFPEERGIPGEVEDRLKTLRLALGGYGWVMSRRTLDDLWRYCAAAIPLMQLAPMEVLDWALAQRALPAMLAAMDLEALHALPELLRDMPRCLKLMDQPLPLPAL